jgi:hypothetical protein
MAYQTSQGLASLGRNGDSMLVHMNPTEVAGLQSLAMSQGGSLTINPDTGLPEAFKLGGFFKSLLPMFAGMAVPASAGLWAGIAAGAATGALTNKDKLMGALTGGLGGYSGFGLGQGLRAAAGTSSLGAVGGGSSGLATGGGYIPGATSAADIAYNSAMMAPTAGAGAATAAGNVGTSMMTDPGILNARNAAQTITAAGGGAGSPIAGSAASAGEQALSNLGSNVSQLKQGFGNVLSGDQAAIDAYTKGIGAKTGMGALAKTALPIGGAALGGIEPSDLYGEPINMDEAKKKQAYNPNASLNLSGDTGLRLYAEGGTIATGGIRDLYGSSDNQNQAPLSRDGYGLGRLNQLGNQQSLSQAQTLGYAMGGPVSFADGGDSNKEDALGLPSLTPDMSMSPNAGADNSAMIQSVMGAMQPTQGMQGNASMTQGQMPDQNNDSLISQVTANLRADPNYQPTNPIEASIVKQIKGTDPMQQGQPSLQGLGSIAPSQPMAPSYSPSVAMGPTYFAGMNAPRGYAEGGETSMSLDKLPSLNVETGKQISANGLTSGVPAYGIAELLGDAFSGNSAKFLEKYPKGVGLWDLKENTRKNVLAAGQNPSFISMPQMIDAIQAHAVSQGRSAFGNYDTYKAGRKQQGYMAKGGYLDGQGDGMSDSIPATIEGKQPARLADGEFVVPADVVSHIGNGSSKAGSQRLYSMLDKVRKARTGHTKQGKQIKPEKYMPA